MYKKDTVNCELEEYSEEHRVGEGKLSSEWTAGVDFTCKLKLKWYLI